MLHRGIRIRWSMGKSTPKKYGILWTNDRHIGKDSMLIVQSGCNSFQRHSVYHFACPNITTTVSTIKEVDPCMSNVRTYCYYYSCTMRGLRSTWMNQHRLAKNNLGFYFIVITSTTPYNHKNKLVFFRDNYVLHFEN